MEAKLHGDRARGDALAALLEEATGDAVVVVDATDRVVRWPARGSRLFGPEAAEALGRLASEVLPLPRRDSDGPSVFALLARGERWGCSPDPSTIGAQLVWSASPLLDEAGAFCGAIYRVRSQEVGGVTPGASGLESVAFEAASEQMAVLDRHRRIVAANAAFRSTAEQAVGHELLLGDDMLAYAAPGTEAAFLDAFTRALDGEAVRSSRAVKYPNGVEFEQRVEYTPLARAGVVEGVLFGSVLVDELRRPLIDQGLLDKVFEVSPFVVIIADARKPDTPIVYASGAVELHTGYARAELIGRNPRVFQGKFTQQPGLAVVRRALAAGEPCDVIVRNQRKDGSSFWNRLFISPIRDDLGAVSHFVGVQQDVTEHEALVARVRTSQSNEATQHMLAGAVHDLRNMLTVVAAQVGLAREDVVHDEAVEASLDAANDAIQQAAALTRLLLSPTTRATPVARATAFADVLNTVRAVARYALAKDVKLIVESPAQGASVLADRGALERVVLNLLLNASEAMPSGGTIHVGVSRGLPDDAPATEAERVAAQSQWTLAVADEGHGMTDEVRSRIFEPYFTTKQDRGTGLGLPTCAALVGAVGGSIRVSSRVGRGSTFYVSLLPAEDAAHGERASRATTARSVEGWSVLVVEPDTSVRAALSTCLRRRGARVRDAGDVETARVLSAEMGPSALLLIDSAPPGALQLVSDWLNRPDRRALVLGSLDEALPAGAGALPKPFDYDALVLAVTDLLEQRLVGPPSSRDAASA